MAHDISAFPGAARKTYYRDSTFRDVAQKGGGGTMAEWWSIEVFSGDKLPASGWRYAYEDELTEAAITHGALYYEWHDSQYGVIFEVLFPGDGNGRRSARCPRCAPPSTPYPTRSTACSSTAAGAARPAAPSRASPSRRRAPPRSSSRSRARSAGVKRARRLKYNGL